MRGYGPGNIAYKYLRAIKRAKELNVPIVVTTQCLEGATSMHLYEVGRQALSMGAIQTYDMSLENLTVKLMWAIKHAKTVEEIKKIMYQNYTGEINKEGKIF